MNTSRRRFLRSNTTVATAALLEPWAALGTSAQVPRSVRELWEDFDPRRDPLETEVIREWEQDGGVFRHVRYLIGNFNGRPARMAAIHGFPKGGKKLPAVLHIHGGGQRAFLHEVKFLVGLGYAALSVNWGGSGTGVPPINAPEGAQPGDPNTDWGAVNPTQLNVQGYNSMLPGPKQLYADREHPKNCNWYLLTLGCRRGLTFLEQQPEVDPQRLGVHGFSMGGNLTMYVAGTDARVQAAVPGVGGQGWRWQPHSFTGGTAQQEQVRGDLDTFRKTLSFESYAPLIRCPVLHRSGTNDFHGWMDDVYRTNALIPGQATRYCWSPHLNHRLIPEVEVAMPLWFDHYLKGGPALPETPATQLVLEAGQVPRLKVTPAQHPWPVTRCQVYFSVDPDPRARFWRSAEVAQEQGSFTARLPLHTSGLPLFAFANVSFALPRPISLKDLPGHGQPVQELCLSSRLHRVEPSRLREEKVALTAEPGAVIDDFAHGLRDWYQLNAGNLAHQETWTRKVTDPLYRAPTDAKLRLIENEWRSYRAPKKIFVCEREVQGADAEQSLLLAPSDFALPDGSVPSWGQVDQLGICSHYPLPGAVAKEVPTWTGKALVLVRLEWV